MVTIEKLVKASSDAKEMSYSPYSNFRVGCALLMEDGEIITGANVENVAHTGTSCAERTAMVRSVAKGYTPPTAIKAIAVNADTENYISPCGVCRQVMIELIEPDIPVYLSNAALEYEATTVGDLLPGAFTDLDS